MGRVLKIDLTSRETSEYPWSNKDKELYLGGKIMAAKILYDNLPQKIDPFSPENLLVITTSPLTATAAPTSSRFNISTLSPLTGLIGSSNSGGSFGIMLKKAGYDGLIISGRAEKPLWIEIDNEQIIFHEAEDLWGRKTGETQEYLGSGTGKIVIGPAGENLVRFASIVSDERISGRTGVGAVMGSKNLKAITVKGNKAVPIKNQEKKKEVYKKWVKQLKDHPLTGKHLPMLGSAGLLSSLQANKILATRNFQSGQYIDFEAISGEALAENHLIKNKGCMTCPIQCGRLVEIDNQEIKGPELETLVLLGSNLENNSLETILRMNYLIDELGMDTISLGGTLAFAMELQEKGLWDSGVSFGQTAGLLQVIEDIAYRRGNGDLLAEGTKRLSERFGGEDFAIHVKGLELPAYEPRGAVGQGLGYATSNRGACHLNGGYMVLLEGLGLSMDPYTEKAKPALTIMLQNIMEAISAGGSCLFTMYAAIPRQLIENPYGRLTRFVNKILPYSGGSVSLINNAPKEALPLKLGMIPHLKAITAVTGINMTIGRLIEIGERGYNLERLFNLKMGLTKADDTLPKRLTEQLQEESNPNSRVPLTSMLEKYYKLRGWDNDGIPTDLILKKLKIIAGEQ